MATWRCMRCMQPKLHLAMNCAPTETKRHKMYLLRMRRLNCKNLNVTWKLCNSILSGMLFNLELKTRTIKSAKRPMHFHRATLSISYSHLFLFLFSLGVVVPMYHISCQFFSFQICIKCIKRVRLHQDCIFVYIWRKR